MPDRSKSLGAMVQYIDSESGKLNRQTLFLLQAEAGKSRELAAIVLNFLIECKLISGDLIEDTATQTSSSRRSSVIEDEGLLFENAMQRNLYKVKISTH